MRFRDIVMTAATQGGGTQPLGPEVWPQPDFSATTGLTLAGTASVSGGSLILPTNSACTGTLNGADPVVAGQTWRLRVVITAATISGPGFRVGCASNGTGGTIIAEGPYSTPGTYDIDVVITTLTGQFARAMTNAGRTATLDSMSLRRVL